MTAPPAVRCGQRAQPRWWLAPSQWSATTSGRIVPPSRSLRSRMRRLRRPPDHSAARTPRPHHHWSPPGPRRIRPEHNPANPIRRLNKRRPSRRKLSRRRPRRLRPQRQQRQGKKRMTSASVRKLNARRSLPKNNASETKMPSEWRWSKPRRSESRRGGRRAGGERTDRRGASRRGQDLRGIRHSRYRQQAEQPSLEPRRADLGADPVQVAFSPEAAQPVAALPSLVSFAPSLVARYPEIQTGTLLARSRCAYGIS